MINTDDTVIGDRLPDKVKVRISKGKKAWIAYLPEYDVFTEADSRFALDYHINDLIFSYFEVPDTVRGFIEAFKKTPD